MKKESDPRSFSIPCTNGSSSFTKALCDLGASINLMSLVMFKQFGLIPSNLTTMRLLMANYTVKKLVGVSLGVLLKVDNFIFLVDFVISDYEVDFEILSILGRLFLPRVEHWSI